jgi:hypothetical protein
MGCSHENITDGGCQSCDERNLIRCVSCGAVNKSYTAECDMCEVSNDDPICCGQSKTLNDTCTGCFRLGGFFRTACDICFCAFHDPIVEHHARLEHECNSCSRVTVHAVCLAGNQFDQYQEASLKSGKKKNDMDLSACHVCTQPGAFPVTWTSDVLDQLERARTPKLDFLQDFIELSAGKNTRCI